MESTTTYHEIDFLLPAQRFNINFTYVTQKGLPFVREFVLRLVHLGPMSKSQIATFVVTSLLSHAFFTDLSWAVCCALICL